MMGVEEWIMSLIRLEGIIPATVTPMTKDYRVDEEALRDYIRWLLKFKIGGLAINVDTGEGPHLYKSEKVRILRLVKEVAGDRVPIVAGLQASFTAEAVEASKEFGEAGADAFLVFPIPAFIGEPLPPEIPYSYHKAIYDASNVPLVLFQLQRDLGGVEYTQSCLLRLAGLEGVTAIKVASFNAMKFLRTLRLLRSAPRKITILTGNDNFILESLILGADGALIGFGTIATDLQIEMFNLVREERYREAAEIWDRLQPLVDTIFAPPVRDYRARLKEALVQLGVLRNSYVRPPLMPLSEGERRAVRKALKEAEIL